MNDAARTFAMCVLAVAAVAAMKIIWTCYAKPAALNGRTCGHHNDGGCKIRDRILCCSACGATKIASDLRAPKVKP